MVFGIVMLVIIYIIWALFVRGLLWKLILFFAGWVGLHLMLQSQHWSEAVVGTVGGFPVDWSVAIPTAICVMALLTSKFNE